VRRFVFVSSIKVNGEGSLAPPATVVAYGPEQPPRPQDAYGRSKWAAELALLERAAAGAFEPVILRPPLIYGPGVKGNLLALMRWIHAGRPLPDAAPPNRRSLLGVDNLALALAQAVRLPDVGGRVFTLAEVEISSAALAETLAAALGVRTRLVHCPAPVWRALAVTPRGRALRERWCGSLLVDAAAARAALEWTPRVSFANGIQDMADWYLACAARR
jgi:nucleoside-diphosphate-sugar epimerase